MMREVFLPCPRADLLVEVDAASNHVDFQSSFFSACKISGIESVLKPQRCVSRFTNVELHRPVLCFFGDSRRESACPGAIQRSCFSRLQPLHLRSNEHSIVGYRTEVAGFEVSIEFPNVLPGGVVGPLSAIVVDLLIDLSWDDGLRRLAPGREEHKGDHGNSADPGWPTDSLHSARRYQEPLPHNFEALFGEQGCVEPLFLEETSVSTGFHNPSTGDDHDAICVDDSGKTVCDGDSGPVGRR